MTLCRTRIIGRVIPRGVGPLCRAVGPIRCKGKERSEEEGRVWNDVCTSLVLASVVMVGHELLHPHEVLAAVQKSETHPMELYRLAENEDFWSNMARYSRFFFSVMVGTVYTILRPFAALLKKPVSAAVIIGSSFLLYLFISSTLKAMLGLNDMDM